MSADPVTAAIIAWISGERREEGLEAVDLCPDSALLDAGILDSLMLLQLIDWLEKCYGITVGVENLTPTAFATPVAIADLVQRLSPAAQPTL